MQFTPQEKELLLMCITKMLAINNHEHGEICCNLILGVQDRSEELLKLKEKVMIETEFIPES